MPANTGSGESDFVIDKFAAVWTVVSSVAELFPGAGSVVEDDTDAVFDTSAIRPGFTLTTRVSTTAGS